MALGISAAAGSFGQFALLPVTQWLLLTYLGWYGALLALAGIGAADGAARGRARREIALRRLTRSAVRGRGDARGAVASRLRAADDRLFRMRLPGRVHRRPSSRVSRGQGAAGPRRGDRARARSASSISSAPTATGWLGSRMPRKYILSGIYFSRSVVIALFVWLPLTPLSVYAFAVALGLLWLSTVPPTNSLVAHIFGVRYLAMLAGFTFFSHQIGSFLGAWLGGLALRPDRQLRPRVVAVDRARHRRGPPEPADRRARDQDARSPSPTSASTDRCASCRSGRPRRITRTGNATIQGSLVPVCPCRADFPYSWCSAPRNSSRVAIAVRYTLECA